MYMYGERERDIRTSSANSGIGSGNLYSAALQMSLLGFLVLLHKGYKEEDESVDVSPRLEAWIRIAEEVKWVHGSSERKG